MILTSRVYPSKLFWGDSGQSNTLDINRGLPDKDAIDLLRQKDPDGTCGLLAADEYVLRQISKRTFGCPQALELVVALLLEGSTLDDVLADQRQLLPEELLQVLIGDAFSRLDEAGQKVMQALATYRRPIPSDAVEYLLRPYLSSGEIKRVQPRLTRLGLIQRQGANPVLLSLQATDAEYSFFRLPAGLPTDARTEPVAFTQSALLHRAADYFQRQRRTDDCESPDEMPQMCEFELLYRAGAYDAAADVLRNFYCEVLYPRGHYRRAVDLYLRLRAHLDDFQTWGARHQILGGIASAYSFVGQIRDAVDSYRNALDVIEQHQADILNPSEYKSVRLHEPGMCYQLMGDWACALECYLEAQQIDLQLEGQLRQKLKSDVSAEVLQELDHRAGARALKLIALGDCLGEIGETEQGFQQVRSALELCGQIPDPNQRRSTRSFALFHLSQLLLDKERPEDAIHTAADGLKEIPAGGDEMAFVLGNTCLALGCLLGGDVAAARRAAEATRKHDVPELSHACSTLRGIIALRQADLSASQEAFREAVEQAKGILKHTSSYFSALDSKGLALAGLILCEVPGDLDAVIEAHRNARAISGKVVGAARRVQRLYEALAPCDPKRLLGRVYAAIGVTR